MRRKVIQQRESYTITLPKAWAKQSGITGESEVDFTYADKYLLVGAPDHLQEKSLKIHIPHNEESFIRIYLWNIYHLGYTELDIYTKDTKVQDRVRTIVEHQLLGWEITSQTEKHIHIETISKPDEKKHVAILRRMLHIVKDTFVLLQNPQEMDARLLEQYANSMMRYNNVCKRMISEQRFFEEKSYFYWELYDKLLIVHRTLVHIYQECVFTDISLEQFLEVFDNLTQAFYSSKNQSEALAHVRSSTQELRVQCQQILKEGKKNALYASYEFQLANTLYYLAASAIGIRMQILE